MSSLKAVKVKQKKVEKKIASSFSLEQLKKHSFFKYFNDEEWSKLKNSITEYVLNAGDNIFTEGETKERFQGIYFVSKGFVSVSRLSLSGRNHYVRILQPGEIFFNPGLFDGGPSPATLKVIEDANVLYISRNGLIPVLTGNPKAAESAYEALADVIRQAIAVIDGLAFKDNSSRLATLLLDVSNREIIKRNQFSLQFISNCINTVPEVVSRELKKLSDDGLIEITRTQIKILDRKGLQTIASR